MQGPLFGPLQQLRLRTTWLCEAQCQIPSPGYAACTATTGADQATAAAYASIAQQACAKSEACSALSLSPLPRAAVTWHAL